MAKHPQLKRFFDRKYDGIVEAVHLTSVGKIEWVRAYERRGPTWSDRVLLDRKTLIERLKSGKRFFTGKRIENMASEFEVSEAIKLLRSSKGEVIVTNGTEAKTDYLANTPLI